MRVLIHLCARHLHIGLESIGGKEYERGAGVDDARSLFEDVVRVLVLAVIDALIDAPVVGRG